jgi:peptide/nickel transport system permease protein
VLVENVFALGCIGALLIEAIQSSDYPMMQAIIMFLLALLRLLNLAIDIIYVLIDPRIRAAAQSGRNG